MDRTYWSALLDKAGVYSDNDRVITVESKANLVSSLLYPIYKNTHAPALDIDIPSRLVPSSTPGHFHLYLEHQMTWRRYKRLLRALYKAGIIQRGFYKLSVKRGATFLRKPGVKK